MYSNNYIRMRGTKNKFILQISVEIKLSQNQYGSLKD